MTTRSVSLQACVRLTAALLVPWMAACQPNGRSNRSADASPAPAASSAPYQAEVEEGLGVAVAILVDTSGSMRERAPGDSRPKYVVAQESIEAMLDATDAFIAKRPDFPIKIGVYSFSSGVRTLRPIQPYNRAEIRAVLAPDLGGDPTLPNYGTELAESDYRPIPAADLPFGLPAWMGDDSWGRTASPRHNNAVARSDVDPDHQMVWQAPISVSAPDDGGPGPAQPPAVP